MLTLPEEFPIVAELNLVASAKFAMLLRGTKISELPCQIKKTESQTPKTPFCFLLSFPDSHQWQKNFQGQKLGQQCIGIACLIFYAVFLSDQQLDRNNWGRGQKGLIFAFGFTSEEVFFVRRVTALDVLQAALDIAWREGCLRLHKHHKPRCNRFGARKSALLPIPAPVPLASLEVLKEATFPCLFPAVV